RTEAELSLYASTVRARVMEMCERAQAPSATSGSFVDPVSGTTAARRRVIIGLEPAGLSGFVRLRADVDPHRRID
ncbi:MAG TPA: hypothetical protein VID96_01500, partial [Xanthobacteraceae bacterium]